LQAEQGSKAKPPYPNEGDYGKKMPKSPSDMLGNS
jgi:hypothetical protein